MVKRRRIPRTSTCLEDLFDMGSPSDYSDLKEDQSPDIEEAKKDINKIQRVMADIDKINAALPMVEDLVVHENEMDDLAEKATQSFEDISNLAMNQEARFGARMFEVAGQMLGHAITAKNAKMEKKLKTIELQIKKFKIDKEGDNKPDSFDGEGIIIDRNELVSNFLNQKE